MKGEDELNEDMLQFIPLRMSNRPAISLYRPIGKGCFGEKASVGAQSKTESRIIEWILQSWRFWPAEYQNNCFF